MANLYVSGPIEFSKGENKNKLSTFPLLLLRIDSCIDLSLVLHQDFAEMRRKVEDGAQPELLTRQLSPEIINIMTRSAHLHSKCQSLESHVINITKGIYKDDGR